MADTTGDNKCGQIFCFILILIVTLALAVGVFFAVYVLGYVHILHAQINMPICAIGPQILIAILALQACKARERYRNM